MGEFTGKRVLVMGLGSFGGGIGAVRFLVEQGAKVTVTDTYDEKKLADSLGQLDGLPVSYHLGGHRQEDFTAANTDCIVVNPAVKKSSAFLQAATQQGVPLTSEMNLFFGRCPAKIIAVTGSNGKSTTTAMIAEVLQAGTDRKVWLGGNIGKGSLLCEVGGIGANDLVVLELSSFQLFDLGAIERSPDVAVVTNIAPNHLDWHGSMAAYVQAKQNIVRYQSDQGVAVLNRLDGEVCSWGKLTAGQVVWYPEEAMGAVELTVPGRHNQENAAAALAVAGVLGVSEEAARKALAGYRALPHRLELVRELAGVRYYNDSIATTPESVIAALESFAEEKIFILGGYDKQVSFEELARRLVMAGNVRAVILLGQVREILAVEIERAKKAGRKERPECVKVDSLVQAVERARDMAKPGTVVLLSPACASYDMFRNFQQRGELFREFVGRLSVDS